MRNHFTRGLIIGGIIGASVSMLAGPNLLKNRSRKQMMRSGRRFIRKSGNFIGDMVDMFR